MSQRSWVGLVGLVAIGAAGLPVATPVHAATTTTAPVRVVLRVDVIGGPIAPVRQFARLPLITVYSDGQVIQPGPSIAVYPPPALPSVQYTRIDLRNVELLRRWALAAGVDSPATDIGAPRIAGVYAVTRFTVDTSTGLRTLTVPALDESIRTAGGLTAAQLAQRRALVALRATLANVGALAEAPYRPYVTRRMSAVATRWTVEDRAVPSLPAVTWPGPPLPGAPIAGSVTCVTVTGPALAAVIRAAGKARTLTPWASNGKRWTVALRPLMPDQQTCRDLIG